VIRFLKQVVSWTSECDSVIAMPDAVMYEMIRKQASSPERFIPDCKRNDGPALPAFPHERVLAFTEPTDSSDSAQFKPKLLAICQTCLASRKQWRLRASQINICFCAGSC